uniref:Uncharacterized protein n=1 Tax=Ciona intestinalis TaxID=7719 RepID=H2Y1W8_CIOIN
NFKLKKYFFFNVKINCYEVIIKVLCHNYLWRRFQKKITQVILSTIFYLVKQGPIHRRLG